jgi:hypothetical protein
MAGKGKQEMRSGQGYHPLSKEFAAVVVSTDKALAYFAAHPEMVLELLELYYKGSAFALKQVA